MTRARPGDVWLVDLGLAAKVRPCLMLSEYPADDELALMILIPHTTAVRGNRWEFNLPKPFLKAGVVSSPANPIDPDGQTSEKTGRVDGR